MQDKPYLDDNTLQDLARDPMMADSQREARAHTIQLLLGRYRTTMASSLEMLAAFQLQPKHTSARTYVRIPQTCTNYYKIAIATILHNVQQK